MQNSSATQEQPKAPNSCCAGKGLLAAAAVFAVVTPVFLWPSLLPWTLFRHVPTLDSALSASILGHVGRSITQGGRGFWDFGIYFPLKDMLCLSDPMITPSVLFAPLVRPLGAVACYNLYIYFAWYVTALGSWAYLRNLGLSFSCAFLGAFIVTFSPARLWHTGGHMHLFLQAGFPLVLLALDRACTSRRGQLWIAVFGLSLLAQIFAGFYILVIFAVWFLFMGPATLYLATRESEGALGGFVKRHGLHFAAWFVLSMVLLAPVVSHFHKFGEGYPELLPEKIALLSANWGSYFILPSDPERLLTLPGLAYALGTSPGMSSENTLYVGLTPTILAIAALALGVRKLRGSRGLNPRGFVYGAALLATAITFLLLSFGPFLILHDGQRIKVPYYYLYAWVDSIRFFRAPARFGLGVQIPLGIAAAFGLGLLQEYYRAQRRARMAAILPYACVALVMIEYFSLVSMPKIDCTPDAFTRMLLSEPEKKPFVPVPFDQESGMAQFSQHNVPMADGYSGYGPAWRGAELEFFQREFPSTHSLFLLERWGIRRVFVSKNALPSQISGAREWPNLKQVWSDSSAGVLYEYTGNFREFEDFLARSRGDSHANDMPHSLDLLSGRRVSGPPEVDCRNSPIITTAYTVLHLRVKLVKPLQIREVCAMTWSCGDGQEGQEGRNVVLFVVRADGKPHELTIPLGSQIQWVTSKPVTHVSFRFGNQQGGSVSVERAALEIAPVEWKLEP